MGFGVVCSWSHLLLYAILVAQLMGSDAREIKNSGHDHHPPTIFFYKEDLKVGNTLSIKFQKTMDTNRFLPRHQADSIPFSIKQFPEILDFFSFTPNSKEASVVLDTLQTCDGPAVRGETKFCATSFEQMVESMLDTFGLKPSDNVPDQVTVLRTRLIEDKDKNHDTLIYQNFTLLKEPQQMEGSMKMGCHIQLYPYTVSMCHTQEGGTKVYKLLLRGRDTGDLVEAAGVCHMDTSSWDPSHLAFREYGIKLGDPVCHIFPLHGHFLWVYNPKGATAIV